MREFNVKFRIIADRFGRWSDCTAGLIETVNWLGKCVLAVTRRRIWFPTYIMLPQGHGELNRVGMKARK